ncbi:uncharacterized protein LOC135694361 [Rhopilema esculentum]|uniref:uncharacterized protein LOC135694361 n=1 Tax=Rhopilema esculentum TaxID=499914 RepID=UPI0031E3A508
MKSVQWVIDNTDGKVKEICTDAHATISKIMKSYPSFSEIHHSLDVWHKASKLTTKLTKLAKKNKHKALATWIPSIRNHFWFCCSMCDGDEFKFRILWARLLHHICDDHDFCTHEPILDEDQEKIFLSSNSGTMEELRQIVLDLAWMKSLAHYTRNRHTGMIEVFNSLTLEYCPKIIG